MANHYRSVLSSGGGVQPTGDAVAADVLAGKTFSNASAVGINGTMPNRGAVSGQATPSQPYTIPAGYHNGSGVVTATSPDPTSGTFSTNQSETKTITTASRPKLIVAEVGTKYKVIYDANKSTTQYDYASSGSVGIGTANLGSGVNPSEFTFNVTNNGFTFTISNSYYYGDWHYTYVL